MIPPHPMVLLFMQTQSLNLCTFRYIFMKSRLRLSFFISSIFPMVKGKIHYHPVWFLIETTFAYFSNHHLSKALKQLIKYITSFTEHSLTSIAFFITSSAALKRDGIYLCRLQVEIHFPTSKSRYASDESESTLIP